jgi:uncharacterized phage protein gp47/JayE
MSYVDETGIYLDTFDEVKNEFISDLNEIFGEGVNTDNAARFGQLINIICERIADQNELVQLVANNQDPVNAIGVWLEQIVRINGIDKNESEFSTATVQITASASGTTVLAGDTIEDPSVGEPFAIESDTTVAPSGTALVTAIAVNPGAIEAASGTLTKINNPRYGWVSVTNTADASPGTLEESDADLRIRRELAANQTGNSSPSAIYRKLADIDGVTEVSVLQNTDDITDAQGIPPHSLWAIVNGGVESVVGQTLFENVGAGVGFYGNNTYNYDDPVTGDIWPIKWSYGVEIPIYVTVRTRKKTGYPSDGDATMEQNIVDFFDGNFTVNGSVIPAFGLGDDVESARIYTPANVVPNHEIVEILISTSTAPSSSATIAITPEQYAGTDLVKISVENVI